MPRATLVLLKPVDSILCGGILLAQDGAANIILLKM